MDSGDRDQIRVTYELAIDNSYFKRQFTEEEKRMLRPIAETISMLDGNAFLSMSLDGGKEWYEQYLPEAYALFVSNGGGTGWASECSWIKDQQHENDSVKEAYESWRTLKNLSNGATDADDNSRSF